MNNEILLIDRIDKIKSINEKYDLENNAYLSFSGGKDSTILHYLLDLALPGNKIPRVFINTGIEYLDIVKFVKDLASKDDRFVIVNPSKNIKMLLEQHGYPFKSKEHSKKMGQYQRGYRNRSLIEYRDGVRIDENGNQVKPFLVCPKVLKYQFEEDFKIQLSESCCYYLKKKPASLWAKENKKSILLTGMRKAEGGQRTSLNCIIVKNSKLQKFHPLIVVNDNFEDWFIDQHNIELCKLYNPPYNFKRTGCKGCPFSIDLQNQLDVMKKILPNEYKQCELIWKPVYDEYRRINYRLRNQMTIYDFINEEKKN
jgi:3'-phosphoadenosine 5'-phosphosulfate sulfotransferase (PAPS reductase)/FAD synthetase